MGNHKHAPARRLNPEVERQKRARELQEKLNNVRITGIACGAAQTAIMYIMQLKKLGMPVEQIKQLVSTVDLINDDIAGIDYDTLTDVVNAIREKHPELDTSNSELIDICHRLAGLLDKDK